MIKMKYDIVVVGGGLVGCLTALELAEQGLSCALLEKGALFGGASGRNAGGIYFQLPHQTGFYGPYQQKLVTHQVPLLKHSQQAWQKLRARFRPNAFVPTGGMVVAGSDDEVDALGRKYAMEQSLGLPTQWLDQQSLQSKIPDLSHKVKAATFCPEEGHWYPGNLAQQVSQRLLQSEVTVLTGESLTHIEKSLDFDLVTSHQRQFKSSIVVGALGASTGWLLDQLGQAHGIEPLAIQMAAVRCDNLTLNCFLRRVQGRLSIKQMPHGDIYIGGGWPATQAAANQPPTINTANLIRNIQLAIDLFPNLASASLKDCWGGWAAWTDDGLPVIGAAENCPGLLLACGGHGYTFAPLYAELLRDLALGHTPALDLAAFRLDRFYPSEPKTAKHSPWQKAINHSDVASPQEVQSLTGPCVALGQLMDQDRSAVWLESQSQTSSHRIMPD